MQGQLVRDTRHPALGESPVSERVERLAGSTFRIGVPNGGPHSGPRLSVTRDGPLGPERLGEAVVLTEGNDPASREGNPASRGSSPLGNGSRWHYLNRVKPTDVLRGESTRLLVRRDDDELHPF